MLIPELTIPGLTLKNVVSETTQDGNSRIGAHLLEYGVLTIDYKNSKSHFEPFSQSISLKEALWDLSSTFTDGKLVIGRVWSKELKTISIGDDILSINGIDISSVSECAFLLDASLSDIKVATLKIRNRRGEIQAIEIQKK